MAMPVLQEQAGALGCPLPKMSIPSEVVLDLAMRPRHRAAAFLDHDPAAASEEASSTVEAEASEVLRQAKVSKKLADRA
eukprot:CAMPEP_0114688682 /NCGR_PEP_ID=MMETSP0191-20121206/63730_1 /TAXON_ID=126664 /ORGANISM="Sorites sp." /LENGTH=78 /DNA_ID=CAMNT_0001976425 /DNA_START=51 /DNA_END=283 /DNA_ORIENTATION=-